MPRLLIGTLFAFELRPSSAASSSRLSGWLRALPVGDDADE